MRLSPSSFLAFTFLAALLPACTMPPLPSTNAQDEDGLLLHNVRLYSAQGDQLQLFGQFSEVRFSAGQHLLKSKRAKILWIPEEFHFQAQRLDARLDTQEVWAFAGWKFQTRDNAFGEGTSAYGYKDKLADMYAQTQEPVHLWQQENTLEAQGANCEEKTKSCEFFGAVKTTFNKTN